MTGPDRPSFRALLRRLRVEAHAVWLAARDPRTPWPARVLGLLIAAYALSPIDLIPDVIPVLGLLDEALLIPAGLWLFARLVPPPLLAEYRAQAESAAQRPVSRIGAALVIVVWVAAAGLLLRLLWRG